jgi:hypothetical protein
MWNYKNNWFYMKFAISDDDISFFTKPMELESLYKDLWEKNIPVSFAVNFLLREM